MIVAFIQRNAVMLLYGSKSIGGRIRPTRFRLYLPPQLHGRWQSWEGIGDNNHHSEIAIQRQLADTSFYAEGNHSRSKIPVKLFAGI